MGWDVERALVIRQLFMALNFPVAASSREGARRAAVDAHHQTSLAHFAAHGLRFGRDAGKFTKLLEPYPAALMVCYPVSQRVNDVRNDDEREVRYLHCIASRRQQRGDCKARGDGGPPCFV